MEKIKVNMSPNPLDVQTIHASQNDSEAREWEFELHNNGDVIDASEISDQLVFKAYKGGTEQILPENTSTPTTSPFKGDICYPQGLLTDQEFTYRQSPTEEDGNAKIKSLYGNTLVWNQLVENGNFATDTRWGITGASKSVANNSITITANSANPYLTQTTSNIKANHKYLVMFDATCSIRQRFNFNVAWSSGNNVNTDYANANTKTRLYAVITPTVTPTAFNIYMLETTVGATAKLENVQIFDLTQMSLDITDPSDFTSLFPLSYYSYNQGSLLSFNGNGIKTVGFNQWDEEWEVGAYNSTSGDKTDSVRDRIRNKNPIRVSPSLTYYKNKGLQIYYYDADMNYLGWNSYTIPSIITQLPSNAYYINFNGLANTGTTYNHDICINISDTERNGEYEPYTSSTLSLPISTYFPSGMKDVPDYTNGGKIYDEMTSNKADTRVSSVDLGSLNWSYVTTGTALAPYFMAFFSGIKSQGSPAVNKANILCSKYQTVARNDTNFVDKTICADGDRTTLTQIQIKDSSYTDATAFKNSLQGQYLYYELATPTETSFTTASLVTENAEIPLSNNDGVLIGKCTEQLSENPGFFDAKIKLSDSDGECYSNKIQLHVERSPQ